MAERNPEVIQHQRHLSIAKHLGNRTWEGLAYYNLGDAYYSLGDFTTAIECYEQSLSIAKEVGDRSMEGESYGSLGFAHHGISNFKRAIEYHEQHLSIAREFGDRSMEGQSYNGLGNAHLRLCNFKRAIEYHKKNLSIEKEVGDKAGEGRAYYNLGNANFRLGDFKTAIECHEQSLSIAKEVGDKSTEGKSYGGLGLAHYSLFDFKRAIEYHEQQLSIAKEVEDRTMEIKSYGNLGHAHYRICDFTRSIEYHEQLLSIAREVGNRHMESKSYVGLGHAHYGLGDFKRAIEYHKKHLCIAKEVGNRIDEKASYGNLGNAYQSLGDLKRAIEYHEQRLTIAKEIGDRKEEGRSYSGIGIFHHDLGDFQRAKEYHEQHLGISKEVGDRVGEGVAYCNLGNAHCRLCDFEQAITYYEQHLSIAKEVNDRASEGQAYGNLGNVYSGLGDFKRAIEYLEQDLSIAKEVRDRKGEGISYGNLGIAHGRLGDYKRAIEYHEQYLRISKEVGDRNGEAGAHYLLGCDNECWGALHKAMPCYRDSINLYNDIRDSLESVDLWKISFRNECQNTYTALLRTLITLGKTDEALYVAEHGRAQALMDLMKTQYNLESLPSASLDPGKTISDMLSDISTQTVFVSLEKSTVCIWVLCKGKHVLFSQKKIHELEDSASFLEGLMKDAFKENHIGVGVRCENRTLDELEEELPCNREPGEETVEVSHDKTKSLRLLYDCIVGPIAKLLQGDELIIVPVGPLCLAPFAAFIDDESRNLSESTRIRIIPSLTTLKLLADCPESYHSKTGALLVGDPCVEEVTKRRGKPKFKQLQCAREEVKMIGDIIKTTPLMGREATKDQVLKRIASVALVHIAAHGKMETGEIVLAPNPARKSKIPEEKDYILKMSDVHAVKLRARLVVLSCCHSGRGKVSAEGVVGIARAFLGAGARSVLVSLWAINDEATMEFMTSFYQHLRDGNSASVALNQAMKCLRESEKFNAVKYWAPFVLIGDDVTLEFGQKE